MEKILKEYLPYVFIIIGVVLLRTFIITPVIVDGESMFPTLKNNQILLLNKYKKEYKRKDIVVIKYNNNNEKKEKLIKRVIGLPGEYVEYKSHKLYIDGKKVDDKFANITDNFSLEYININMKKIPKGYYLVLGDNRTNSIDSRMIGLIKKEDIKGTVTRSIIPFKKVK